MMTIKY